MLRHGISCCKCFVEVEYDVLYEYDVLEALQSIGNSDDYPDEATIDRPVKCHEFGVTVTDF